MGTWDLGTEAHLLEIMEFVKFQILCSIAPYPEDQNQTSPKEQPAWKKRTAKVL